MPDQTRWELRGYLSYPSTFGKPRPGTRDENDWCKGWNRALEEQEQGRKSQYHLDLENDALAGRETYAANYF